MNIKRKNHLILLLAGNGSRLYKKIKEKKQFVLINSIPLFMYSLKSFIDFKIFDTFVLVVSKDDKERLISILKKFDLDNNVKLVFGGKTRDESVKNAILYLKSCINKNDKVFIHDSARPIIKEETLNSIYTEALKCDALAPVMKIYDSIIHIDNTVEYVNRDQYFKVATPQVFTFSAIDEAYENKNYISSTDDFSKVLALNKFNCKTIIIPNDTFKVTDENDLNIFKSLINNK